MTTGRLASTELCSLPSIRCCLLLNAYLRIIRCQDNYAKEHQGSILKLHSKPFSRIELVPPAPLETIRQVRDNSASMRRMNQLLWNKNEFQSIKPELLSKPLSQIALLRTAQVDTSRLVRAALASQFELIRPGEVNELFLNG